ncbi:Proton-coupled amino acid transporter-like protein pathetic-like 1 [Homarus americanus]|uniref:Proton-coupled amino acid transporter-like protein pathetic-like 1 n=1 Tax=Homarus americanus TaxID=6706 RepID=A0A8J5TL06_HOMAM|nr:Proton-coupled amino acid transporter-like protein pathetic-like 1 [Homarus americanus]
MRRAKSVTNQPHSTQSLLTVESQGQKTLLSHRQIKNEPITRPGPGVITAAVDIKEQDRWAGPTLQERDTQVGAISSVLPEGDINNASTGLLAMPEAFMNAGLWVGFAGIPIMGVICIHCMQMLLRSSKELCKRAGKSALSYEETAEAAFRLGPEGCRKWANTVRYIITTFLIITQVGFCCVYAVFIPQNLMQAIECMLPSGSSISVYGYMGIIILPILLICYIPNLKYLAPVSLMAGAVQIIGITICFYYMLRDLPHVQEELPAFAGFSTLPLYFGSAIYAFEGIGLGALICLFGLVGFVAGTITSVESIIDFFMNGQQQPSYEC